jgi:hypothetical protein
MSFLMLPSPRLAAAGLVLDELAQPPGNDAVRLHRRIVALTAADIP